MKWWTRLFHDEDPAPSATSAENVTGPSANPRDYAFNALLFKRLYRLIKPFWVRHGAWRSWLVFAALMGGVWAATGLGVLVSFLTKNATNALIAKNAGVYWPLFMQLTLVGVAVFLLNAFSTYVGSRLDVSWRQWLTTHLVDRYMQRRTYYEITLDAALDNPDQRIQEEVGKFTNVCCLVPRMILGSVMTIAAQGAILASVSSSLVSVVLMFWPVCAVALTLMFRPTIKQNFEVTVSEADLRYGLLHVRDQAETVAFYGGEAAERQQIVSRLAKAVHKKLVVVAYQFWMELGSGGLNMFWTLIPTLMLVPMFLNGGIEYGSIAQATLATGSLIAAMQMITVFLPFVAMVAPGAIRLVHIIEKFDSLDMARRDADESRQITMHRAASVSMRHVWMTTPGGEQSLVRDLTIDVSLGKHLIVIGQTGVGKSSLLRAMAGLWTRGQGDITMPPVSDMLFLPQRPYMILGDLRSQLLYPGRRNDISDAELEQVLNKVRLPNLLALHGGFNASKDWARTLSLGEQQRIAFARVLVAKPKYVFLDEATSAVDIVTERALYELLAESGATFVSVGHRPALLSYHVHALELFPGGTWGITPAVEVLNRKTEAVNEPVLQDPYYSI